MILKKINIKINDFNFDAIVGFNMVGGSDAIVNLKPCDCEPSVSSIFEIKSLKIIIYDEEAYADANYLIDPFYEQIDSQLYEIMRHVK